MREDILKMLSVYSDEELMSEAERPSEQTLYSKPGRFIIERRTMSNISTGEATAPVCLRSHPRFREFPEHTHDFIEIMYVCSGSITHSIGGKTVTVSEGDLIILGKTTKHSILPSSSSDIGVNVIISADLFEIILNTLRFDSSLSTRTLEGLLGRDGNRYRVFNTSSNIEITNLLENMIYSELIRSNTDGYVLEQSLKLLLCYLCALPEPSVSADGEDTYAEQTKKRILKYIRTSYSSATLTESAQMLGLSPSYLSRWICAAFGTTFKELLMNERFSVACDLLRTTDMPIGDIIIHIGYENSSYFHKQFKKRFGVTPKNYRRGIDKDNSK